MMRRKIKALCKAAGIVLVVLTVTVIVVLAVRAVNHIRYTSADRVGGMIFGKMDTYPLEQEGVAVTRINHGAVNGFHIVPEQKQGAGLVITLGGSERDCNYMQAVRLGQQGYEVAALFYFGQEEQPAMLNRVPIEFFSEFLDYAEQQQIPLSPLTLVGGSKGAELAMVLAERFEEVDHLVLYAPSAYVFQEMDFQHAASSWTWKGEELPFISYEDISAAADLSMLSALVFGYPMELRPMYESALERSEDMEAARLRLQDFEGHMLLFAGAKDALWPSDTMGRTICDAHSPQAELILYPNAGHSFGPLTTSGGLVLGGSVQDNESAGRDSEVRLLEFLMQLHGKE